MRAPARRARLAGLLASPGLGRVLDLFVAAFAAAALGAAAWLVSAGDSVTTPSGATVGSLCWFRELVGVDCPFCGLTRSLVALLDGRVLDAFRFHPAGPLVALWLAATSAWLLGAAVRRRPPLVDRAAFARVLALLVAVSVAGGAARAVAGAL